MPSIHPPNVLDCTMATCQTCTYYVPSTISRTGRCHVAVKSVEVKPATPACAKWRGDE